jgi:hypothetical protein
MDRRKVSGTSRTLGFLREAQNSGVKQPRSQEFKNDAMRNSREIVVLLEFLASWLLEFFLNGPPQDLWEQPHARVSARSANSGAKHLRIQERCNAELA